MNATILLAIHHSFEVSNVNGYAVGGCLALLLLAYLLYSLVKPEKF